MKQKLEKLNVDDAPSSNTITSDDGIFTVRLYFFIYYLNLSCFMELLVMIDQLILFTEMKFSFLNDFVVVV